jgi:hypothetical protein
VIFGLLDLILNYLTGQNRAIINYKLEMFLPDVMSGDKESDGAVLN